jgi:subtilisin-like proprotein convertase family protein
VPKHVFTYYDFDGLKENFPKSLAKNVRVLKQNRGSTGEGIWRVEVIERDKYKNIIPLNAKLKLTQAKDNHTEKKRFKSLWSFVFNI